ncbi:tetratricopeptide repeat protein [Paludisphaera borealis]|uniref:Beta-barrel assembly-enhancing protease n=1 Tax=Paludisphaera borealis TaxID=1387353 RepID=A0A1U7CXA6_9BACT|nr:tetratricopeptide repeat protein [Paludisphaera borealis]APW63582.1 Beta-barrel assembly-enhancing protease [Paludisphaera borealis]
MVATRSYFGAAILIVAAMAVAGWSWHARRGEPATAREARAAVAAGRYEDASAALARWAAAAPDEPEALVTEGRILIARGAVVEAREALKKAIARGVPGPGPALLRALIAAKTGRGAEAVPALHREFAEGRGPDRQVDEALAKVYLEAFDLGRATAVLDRWARDFPDDPKPYLWRAEAHARDGGDPGAVLHDYQEALDRDPKLARARLGLADALRQAHRSIEAAAAYDAYLAAEPNDASAHFGAGRSLLDQGDEEAAIRHLTRASELNPGNAEPLKELAEAAQRRGDWPGALALLDRATALDPNDVPVRYSRGVVLARLGRTEEARAEQAAAGRLRDDLKSLNAARSRLVADPHDRDSQLAIARWMFDHAHEDEGARWAGRILDERPGDSEASRLLADYHERRGETGLANFHRLQVTPEAAR